MPEKGAGRVIVGLIGNGVAWHLTTLRTAPRPYCHRGEIEASTLREGLPTCIRCTDRMWKALEKYDEENRKVLP